MIFFRGNNENDEEHARTPILYMADVLEQRGEGVKGRLFEGRVVSVNLTNEPNPNDSASGAREFEICFLF